MGRLDVLLPLLTVRQTVTGAAAASATPGSQVAVAPGTALEFRLARPVTVDVVI